eukprot:gene2314-3039_t
MRERSLLCCAGAPGALKAAAGEAQAKRKRRARVYRERQLALVVYGSDEALLWTKRVAQFISLARSVLGDRSMTSQWGGSLVDSVVGTFLTQNVSDISSSNAFMAIMARYPANRSSPQPPDPDCSSPQPLDPDVPMTPSAENAAAPETRFDTPRSRQADGSLAASVIQVNGDPAASPRPVLRDAGDAVGQMDARLVNHLQADINANDPVIRRTEALDGILQEDSVAAEDWIYRQPSANRRTVEMPSAKEDAALQLEAALADDRIQSARDVDRPTRQDPDDVCPVRRRLFAASNDLISDVHVSAEGAPPGRRPLAVDAGIPAVTCTVTCAAKDAEKDAACFAPLVDPELATGAGPEAAVEMGSGAGPEAAVQMATGAGPEAAVQMATGAGPEAAVQMGSGAGPEAAVQMGNGAGPEAAVEMATGAGPEAAVQMGSGAGPEAAVQMATGVGPEAAVQMGSGAGPDAGAELLASTTPARRNIEACSHTDAAMEEVKLGVDSVDWEAVIKAPLEDLADTIKIRGMHFMIAGRIQQFLRKVQTDNLARNGASGISLEWLRTVPMDEAREYLMSVTGLGAKSVACIMLLSLQHPEFPVDTNVGRICARLGWVPLEAEDALEDLAQYAAETAVYKYLKERLDTFGFSTLYELHFQMITLGKVFCDKRSPNCAACPISEVCEYAQNGGRKFVKRARTEKTAIQPFSILHDRQPSAAIEQRTSVDPHDRQQLLQGEQADPERLTFRSPDIAVPFSIDAWSELGARGGASLSNVDGFLRDELVEAVELAGKEHRTLLHLPPALTSDAAPYLALIRSGLATKLGECANGMSKDGCPE